MLQILDRFQSKYKHLTKKGLIIEGMVVVDHARRQNAISVSKPFLFDNRQIPKKFEGLSVKKRIVGEMPEYRGGYPSSENSTNIKSVNICGYLL